MAQFEFYESDDETSVNFGCFVSGKSESILLNSIDFNVRHEAIRISVSNGNVEVTAYPEHPDYESFDVPEEAIEYSLPGDEPTLGKVLFNFCLSSKAQ